MSLQGREGAPCIMFNTTKREKYHPSSTPSGRGLHHLFPFPLNLSILCPRPLTSSLIRPPHITTQPVDVCRRSSKVEL